MNNIILSIIVSMIVGAGVGALATYAVTARTICPVAARTAAQDKAQSDFSRIVPLPTTGGHQY